MLHTFVTTHRAAIQARTRENLADRGEPSASSTDLQHGVSAFLGQLSETLRLEETATPFSPTAIGATAARHGRDLFGLGFNVSQVVHDYGDICRRSPSLEVEDQCGGIPDTTRDLFQAFERRASDRTGVGLGLSIAQKSVASQDGNIVVRNMPDTGCVFVIDLPLAPEESSAAGGQTMDR